MSSPYFRFGVQRRYPYQWGAGQGGVFAGGRSAEARDLSDFDLWESGATVFSRPYSALRNTRLHSGVGSVELARPAGYEPVLIDEALGLSDMEKQAATIGGVALVAYLLFRGARKGRRR